jgi:formate dehydrogenase accessory protein FdhE
MKFHLAPPSLDEVISCFEYHRDKPYTSDRYLDFHIELARVLEKNVTDYQGTTVYEKPAGEDLGSKLEAGFALLDPARIVVNEALTGALFHDLCGLFESYGTVETAQVQRLSELQKAGRIDVAGLVGGIVEQTPAYFETLATEISANVSVPVYLAEHLARPILAQCAAAFDPVMELKGNSRTTCPLCGNEPLMALLSDEGEGKRLLHSSLCHTRWEFPRMTCCFCRNEQEGGMRYLHYEGDDVYRANVCDACKRYLKCIDERNCGGRTVVLQVEALVTANLDEMALERDYLRTAG